MGAAVAQHLPQIARPALRQIVKLGLGPAAEGRAQQRGQRQVILRHRQKRQQRRQVPDRQLRAEVQPVGPGNRQTGLFAGADHLAEQVGPALHQNQEIARPHPARALRGDDLHAAGDHLRDFIGDGAGQPRHVMGFADQADGVVPMFIRRGLGRRDQRPQVHPTRFLAAKGLMADLAAKSRMRAAKAAVDKLQNGGGGPK